MPAYHSWGTNAHHNRLPPTPPEYQTSYLNSLTGVSEQGFYPSQSYNSRQGQSSRDYSERYHQLPAYTAQPSITSHAHPTMNHVSQDCQQAFPQQVTAPYHFGGVTAPALPPIRVTEHMDHYTNHYLRGHTEQKPKEEKPTGGVAQHLDYEMDLMASFVAEMSQKLVTPGSTPSTQFRKYVSQILSSTRLPSSTIMLGLFYLASRMKIVTERGQSMSSSGAVYRMLTTCLLLGSKFLDDNTFQNRSWAEVSSISVHELNVMELDWLVDFNWEIHTMMYEGKDDFFSWIKVWHAYAQKAQLAKVKDMHKLAPIDTNIHHAHVPQPLMSPEGPIPPQYQQGSQYDTQWVRPYISEYSPPSAPHSGPATPDYYCSTWSYNQTPSTFSRSSWNSGIGSGYSQRNQLPSYHRTSSFPAPAYSQSTWTGHGSNCGCTLCAKHPDYYFSHAGYGMQTVVG